MSESNMYPGVDAECGEMPAPPWQALVRHARGDSGDEDRAALHDWAAEDPSRLAVLNGVRRLGEVSASVPGGSRADSAWARIQTRMASERRRKTMLRLEVDGDGHRRAVGARVRRLGVGVAAAAAMVVLAVMGGMRFLRRTGGVAAPSHFREVMAPQGGRVALRLPDGTRAVLGPGSRMWYAVDGDIRMRSVHLTGVALFDVAHDTARPFVVHAAGGEAQAVGTSFNVRAYPRDSALVVVVAEGRVALRPAGGSMGSGTMLEPGQRGVLRRGLVRVESGIDWHRELSWTAGRLVYDLAPLSTIAADLERWFGVQVILPDSSWANVRVTVTLEADSAEASLRRLAEVLDVPYRRSGTHVHLGL